jgi:hypothetical protein
MKKCAGEKYYLSDCLYTSKDEAIFLLSEYEKKIDADRKKETIFKKRATTDQRLTTDMASPHISRRRISESRSRHWQTKAQAIQIYRAVLWRTKGSVDSLSRLRCCQSPSC